MRPLWADGKQTVANLRKTQEGVKAINRELDEIARTLPALLRTFQDLRQRLEADQECLLPALEKPEPLRESPPEMAALLQGAERLRELASSLRQTQEGLEQTLRAWPMLVETMQRS